MPLSGEMRKGGQEDRPATVAAVSEHIEVTCGVPSAGPTVGAEVEWLVVDLVDPLSRPSVADLRRALDSVQLPGGSRLSFEPGGQVELSSLPARTSDEAHSALLADLAVVRPTLRGCGLGLVSAARDLSRPPIRVSDNDRYEAMEQWFAAHGWDQAPEMMCNTTSIQVNVGCGPEPSKTWRRANALAPLLAAMFAWSSEGGWASSRLRTWAALDPGRTSSAMSSGDPISDWTDYALAASAVMRERPDGRIEALPGAISLRDWIESPPAGWPPPTMADVEIHLSTLFPPVRLKGWIEVRVIDMPGDGTWPVPLAVTAALLAPPPLGIPDGRFDWLTEIDDVTWQEAARTGLQSSRLAAAADQSLQLAIAWLEEQGSVLVDDVHRFHRERVASRLTTPTSVDAQPVR